MARQYVPPLTPSNKPSSIHRRDKSADNRRSASDSTPEKTANVRPATPGRSQSRPLSISSADNNDDDDHSDLTIKKPCTPTRPDYMSLLHSKTEKGPRFQPPPITPTNTRPTPRKVATAPAGPRKAELENSLVESSPSASKQRYSPPCGYKPYVRITSYNKHVGGCPMCKTAMQEEIQRNMVLANEVDVSGQKQHVVNTAPDNEPKSKEASSKDDDKGNVAESKIKDAVAALEQPGHGKDYIDYPENSSLSQISAKDVHAKLVTQICCDLDKGEKRGWIYLMRSPDKNKAGLVKIGFTVDYPKRQAGLKTKCGLATETIEIWGVIDSIRRIEKLVKTDLLHLKQPWECRKCGSIHGEWFKVDEQIAVRTVKMWIDWLEQEPYAALKIKPLWKDLIETTRRPAKMFDNHDHAARHDHWRKALMKPTEGEERAFGKKRIQVVPSEHQYDGKKEPANMLDSKDVKNLKNLIAIMGFNKY
ncbi:hypothetical protein EJ02DRAFT_457065 [Clathrospora elynae]|uniref:Bacteriophage T5 Orf172 DNA-binding domain-containing protein n=1 Tax=Clathrospora elynae TaxID=706981 RepID=A0A6A5SGV6_9PLEO|nr:hypothetical protein EJ02DRAFT_457065 [Clathrospora elynae]